MLLPSDVARLVLGYLQQEKLASTCSAFIAESPNLKEYAEHYTDEGFVPGCLLSLFGKNLTAILNEYVTMKAKEMTNDVPLMISSLWKKLEFTLSQIRSMQNSAAFSANQRARTRSAIADMRRQKTLDLPSTFSSLSNQSGPLISRPLAARPVRLQCALRPTLIPLSISSSEATEKQPTTSIGDRSTVVPSHKGRKHSNMSPGRRKIDSQKRRPCSSARNLDHSNTAPIEEQSDPLQELIDGNFPKLVIESARDRFLSNKSLQEKLAENINKFLGSDANVAPATRPADSSAADADTAIDEILGLEGGEIHMSDEAIHDILQQTESDPAFQALFDLFDFGKTKEGKKTSTDTMSQNEDCLNPNTLEESYSDTLQNSFTIENVVESNTQNASRDSSNQDEVNSMIVDNTFPETLDRSGNEIVDNHVEMAASNQDSGKLFSSVCKTQVNSADSEETNAQTTVCLHSEREVDKSSTELLPVQDHKQIGKIQESALFEDDIPESFPMESRADEVGSQSTVSNSSPVSPVETATMRVNEKRKSISNEPNLHGSELNNSNISEHSGVMSDVEMKDISSNKDKRTDLECVPDILNIAPLSEDAHATPFVAEPVKLFNESGHEGSTTGNLSTDSSKDQTDGSETTQMSSQIVKPSSAHQMDTQLSHVCSVDIPSQTEASCPPVSKEKQNQVAVPVPIDTSEPPVIDVVPRTSHTEEPTPLAAILKESLPSADVCTDKETISHATSSIEEEHMVGSTQRSTGTSASSTCIGPAPENTFTIIDSSTVPSCAGNVPSSSSSSQLSDVVDPSKIMSLKIIISEDSHLGDAELNNAVSSITGENLPTIVLSSPGKIQVQNVALSQSVSAEESVRSLEGIADIVFVDQCLPVHTFTDQTSGTISFKADDGTVFSVAGASSLSSDGGFLQLMPATSTAFGQSNSVYLTTCMTDNASFRNIKSQSKITPIAAKRQSQVQTPPRPRNVITVGQALSPKVSQGSTIIFASPVQPGMLQMGMIPLSVVGQNRNTYSTFPGQILQMPATSPLSSRGIPKLPIAPKNPKTIGSKSTIHTGRILKRKDEVSSHPVPIQPHRSEPSEAVVTPDGQKKAEEPFIVPSSAPSSSTKSTGSHRRVLYFEDKGSSDPDGGGSQVPNTRNKSQGKERPDSLLHSLQAAVGASQYIKIMQSSDNNKTDNNNSLSASSVSQTDITATKMPVSLSTKDADPGQKVTTSESISDKTSANKENTLTRGSEQQHKQDAQKPSTNQEHVAFNYEKTVPLVKEMSRKGILPNILRKSPLDPRKEVGKSHLISPLSKQAAEMLQGIQMRSPTSKQTGDLPLPRTPGSDMNMLDGVRTPTSKTTFEEGGTPRALLLPATPEMQGCSPASEAGSENSVSMAAHTLMILSRASIANTGNTPLKDNTQHVKSRSTVKKRKFEETEECEKQTRLSKKELQSPQTPLKKKKKKPKNKRSLDSFPAGMDVDKFLLSLHYDE